MTEARRRFDPPSRLTDTQLQQQCPTTSGSKPKANRLRRSFRQTQQPATAADGVDSPKSRQTEFKTPTRVPRSRYVGGFTGESPHNDSELQQDIIWDATSPSPNRPGKRGKKHGGVVDISEIVSRIAPKHGRPKVVEPTLQQWIGDSATIPCTPDVQLAKPKKKSPRPNGVDDLLKLAKQFDFNMFRQDEEQAEDMHQHSLELLSEDILDFESGNENEAPPLLPETSQPAVNGGDSPVHLPLDHHMEDDLDFLFDGPTQRLSGNLSQISLARSSEVKPAPAVSSKEVSGKDSGPLHGPTSSVSTTHSKGTSVDDDFEDDWENDDLINDPLVFEMTQNPHNFAVPKHCSTQRGPCEIQYQRDNTVNIPTNGVVRRQPENPDGQSAVSNVEKENGKHRITFKLEANPAFPVKRILTDASTNFKSVLDRGAAADKDAQQSRFSSSKGLSIETGSQLNSQRCHSNVVKSNPQESAFHQRTSVANSSAKYNTSASISSNTSATKTTQSHLMKPSAPEAISNHKPTEHREVPAVPVPLRNSDFLDEDLDSFFLSDSVWDDQEDDDLLCEMCEDLENQAQSVENLSTKQIRHTLNQRPALAPSNRAWDNGNQQTKVKQLKHVPTNPQSASERGGTCMLSFPPKLTPTSLPSGSSRPAGNSFAGNYASNGTVSLQSYAVKESYRYTQAKSSSGTSSSTYPQGSGIQSTTAPPLGNTVEDHRPFTFKRLNNPVATVTNKVLGKCSAAEIKLKKQQALERRRQRMQTSQNLGAPT